MGPTGVHCHADRTMTPRSLVELTAHSRVVIELRTVSLVTGVHGGANWTPRIHVSRE